MDYPTEKDDPGQGKMLSEIYLTRLLSTKVINPFASEGYVVDNRSYWNKRK